MSPQKRYSDHVRPGALRTKSHKNNWINRLKIDGRLPILKIIRQVDIRKINQAERKYISKFRRENPSLKNGTEGGDGGTTFRQAICCSNGKSYTSITEAASDLGISKSHIYMVLEGLKKDVKGFRFKRITKKRASKESNQKRKVSCSNGVTYSSIKDAAVDLFRRNRSLSLYSAITNISAVCRGKQLTYKGHQYWYSEFSRPVLYRRTKEKPVLCSNGMIYKSTQDAAKNLGLCFKQISAVLRGKQKTCHGYSFKFVANKSKRGKE